jgi:hypothetical protein
VDNLIACICRPTLAIRLRIQSLALTLNKLAHLDEETASKWGIQIIFRKDFVEVSNIVKKSADSNQPLGNVFRKAAQL